MQMRPRDAACPADQPDLLALLDYLADLYLDLRLVPESAEDAPAVVNNGGISPDGQRSCKYDPSCRWSRYGQPISAAEIQAAVEPRHLGG
jgi:hypothetical protein